jgi:uncharacterized protein (TIGR03083 family)
MMDRDEVWRTIHTERAALADILQTLSAADWEQKSLCAGWTIRDVAAHVISSPAATPSQVVAAMVRARGNYNSAIYAEAKRQAARPVKEILADYRTYDGSRRHPIGTTRLDVLLDVLVHTQDIVIPLARRHDMPLKGAAAAADRVWRRAFPFRAASRFRGFRLAATDVAWSVGHGAPVEGPMEAILLLLTGRRAALHRLTGEGVDRLVTT